MHDIPALPFHSAQEPLYKAWKFDFKLQCGQEYQILSAPFAEVKTDCAIQVTQQHSMTKQQG